ncbi:ABC transporter permease subunit [Proteiniclasticum ruminis]|uniref:ABC transporter permease subunit n=1 Tax=Proteiniclasticum ruminis TaxID=398199 RepID=UPI0028AA7245|nr:ABC transporter permease subunit [Proteiniclasticum ruminis]
MNEKKTKLKKTLRKIKEDKVLYLLFLPTLLFFLIFRVWPMVNMRLSVYDYKAFGGWKYVGWKYFEIIFKSPQLKQILENTLIISFMKYILLFPFVVLFAILLAELASKKFRKYVQIISFLPHFLSWVVIAGIWISVLSPSKGAVNQILNVFNLPSMSFMTDKNAIRWVLLVSEAWRSIGWDSIIYYAAIISIDPSIFEAAKIDGANRFKIIKHIILPALVIPMVTMFILNLGFFLNAGFDQVFNFTNDAVNSKIDILDTYIYRIGLINGQYSLGTAVGVIKGFVGVFLVLITHFISKKITGKGVW